VLITSSEARLLREGNWEARAVCTRPWLKSILIAAPLAVLAVAGKQYSLGHHSLAWSLFAGGAAMSILLAAPFLPMYTPERARIFRTVKWITVIVAPIAILGSDALKWSWLIASTIWPVAWIEMSRESIRRKLPVERWPKQLYL